MNNADKKFLFDLNKFDEPTAAEIEAALLEKELEPPPPPTFTEDELEAANAVAFTKGKSEGIQEERAKREQELTNILGEISANFSNLFANEIYREKAYEQEAVKMSIELIKILAPTLEQKFGKDALINTIKDTILSQTKQSEIIIEVANSAKDEITSILDNISAKDENSPRFKVKGREDLSEGSCELSWKDGGMVRNPRETAKNIENTLMKLLNNPKEAIPVDTNSDINKVIDSSDSEIDNKITEEPKPETGENHD